jgi:hypothetical protein
MQRRLIEFHGRFAHLAGSLQIGINCAAPAGLWSISKPTAKSRKVKINTALSGGIRRGCADRNCILGPRLSAGCLAKSDFGRSGGYS